MSKKSLPGFTNPKLQGLSSPPVTLEVRGSISPAIVPVNRPLRIDVGLYRKSAIFKLNREGSTKHKIFTSPDARMGEFNKLNGISIVCGYTVLSGTSISKS